MITKTIQLAAWTALLAIIFVTVSPIGLRPHDLLPVNVDRALAFTGMAALFVLAYPRHWIWVGFALVIGAGAIELLQELSPTRHAHIDDAMVKAAGASIGIVIGWVVNQMLRPAPLQ
jgi:VanZ family protein